MALLRPVAITAAALLSLAACSSGSDNAPPAGSSGSTAALTGATGASGSLPSLTVADQAFLMQAAYGGLAEVALGQLAQDRASSPAVKAFGQRMVADHSQANAELVALARAKGTMPPTEPDPGRQATAAALGTLEGPEFDRQYLQEQLAEHKMAMALYDAEVSGGTDPDVRAFATKWLPFLQDHAQQIRSLSEPMAGVMR